MGAIVHDFTIQQNQGGRHGGTFKDGRFIRAIVFYPDNVIRFHDMEGNILYTEEALKGERFAILNVSDETSSFGTPHIVLGLGGFDPDTSDSRFLILATTYEVSPPEF